MLGGNALGQRWVRGHARGEGGGGAAPPPHHSLPIYSLAPDLSPLMPSAPLSPAHT